MGVISATYKDRDAWLKGRRNNVGGSDAPVLLGNIASVSAVDLYLEKVEGIVREPKYLERLKWGHRLERPIIEGYGEDSDRKITFPQKFEIRVRDDAPWCGYSPDAWQESHDFEGRGVIQAKNVSAFRREDWLDGPPEEYTVQLQHEMMVEGAAWGSLVALFGGNECAWFDVEANEDFQAALFEEERKFWQHVEKKKCPEVDTALQSALATLKKLHPASDGSTIHLKGEKWLQVVDAALELREQRDQIDKELDQCTAIIQAEMGAAEIAHLPDGRRVTWKTQNRKAYEVKASSFRVFKYPKE